VIDDGNCSFEKSTVTVALWADGVGLAVGTGDGLCDALGDGLGDEEADADGEGDVLRRGSGDEASLPQPVRREAAKAVEVNKVANRLERRNERRLHSKSGL
jgi:hypothetical protein